jgi:hypothetical protein
MAVHLLLPYAACSPNLVDPLTLVGVGLTVYYGRKSLQSRKRHADEAPRPSTPTAIHLQVNAGRDANVKIGD